MSTSSVNMRKVQEWAKEYNKTILATDERLAHAVTIIHEEGSFFHYESAFVLKVGQYYAVFAEHQDTNVFAEDEVHVLQHSSRIQIEEMTIPE